MLNELQSFAEELKRQLSFSLEEFGRTPDEILEKIRFKSKSLNPEGNLVLVYYHPFQGTRLGTVVDGCVNNARLLAGYNVKSLASDMNVYDTL